MINDILEKLSNDKEAIVTLLEMYGYEKIKAGTREIRFARDHNGGLNISIRLDNNPACLIKDFVTGECNNIVNFLITQRGADFRTVLQSVKEVLGLNDYWQPSKKRELFGGLYSNIGCNKREEQKIYQESVLEQYDNHGNLLWLKDGISLKVQKEFGIRFDIVDNSVVIPWRNSVGDIIAIKNRVNGNPEEGMSKYYYSCVGSVSGSLYGYSENYAYLQDTEILVGESEKFVLQNATKGYRNCVSLGSNSLSQQQAALLLSLNPKRVIWLMDEGLPFENTLRNARILNEYCTMRSVEQLWWNWKDSLSVPSGSKMSPSDCSKDVFEDILKYELEEINFTEV